MLMFLLAYLSMLTYMPPLYLCSLYSTLNTLSFCNTSLHLHIVDPVCVALVAVGAAVLSVLTVVPHHDGLVHGGGHHPLLGGAEVDTGDGISVSLELLIQFRVRHPLCTQNSVKIGIICVVTICNTAILRFDHFLYVCQAF